MWLPGPGRSPRFHANARIGYGHQGPNKMNLKYNRCFKMFSWIAFKCFCEELNCTYWALAHIVLVVGIVGKQPVTRKWWLDLRWRESGGGSLERRGRRKECFRMHWVGWFETGLKLWVNFGNFKDILFLFNLLDRLRNFIYYAIDYLRSLSKWIFSMF